MSPIKLQTRFQGQRVPLYNQLMYTKLILCELYARYVVAGLLALIAQFIAQKYHCSEVVIQ